MTDIASFDIAWDGDRAPFAKAFVAAQKATEAVKKASTNPAFKSKYADLAGVVEAVVPALNSAGIGVMQFPSFSGDLVGVTTILLHESGASVTGTLHLRPSKGDPQGIGSAITYGRRYSLLGVTGAAPEDDDGNSASGPRQGFSATPDRKSSAQAKRDGDWDRITSEIAACTTSAALIQWGRDNAEPIQHLPLKWQTEVREEFAAKLDQLKGEERRERETADFGAGADAMEAA